MQYPIAATFQRGECKVMFAGIGYCFNAFHFLFLEKIAGMKKYFLLKSIICLSILFISKSAAAQATRTWVSGVGDDVNPASRTAPCKTFAGAISKTAAGGE